MSAAPGFAVELRHLARQNRANELVLFTYSEQPEPARSFLSGLVAALPARLVTDALYVDGSRWWSLTCDQACCPAEGTPYDVAEHRLAAEAVFAGLTTRASREELAATVAGPPLAEVPRLVELAGEVRRARAAGVRGRIRRPGWSVVSRPVWPILVLWTTGTAPSSPCWWTRSGSATWSGP